MSIHLVGGGRDEARCSALLAPFVSEAVDVAAATEPVIALLLVLEDDDETSVERFCSMLVGAGSPAAGIRVEAIVEGDRFDRVVVEGAHGIVVGGGLTPAYHDAIIGIASTIRERVATGVPYAGFSAGAAVAGSRAIVGGYLMDGVVVAPEDTGEELDEVEVREGLGLVPGSVDVHAAQWGTALRLVAAVTAGWTPGGVAIDEHTAHVVDAGGRARVRGGGHVWKVEAAETGAKVTIASAPPAVVPIGFHPPTSVRRLEQFGP